MTTKIFLIVMVSLNCFAKTEAECLTRMSKATKHTEQDMVKIVMTCNNMLLDGIHLFLDANNQTEKLMRKRYPAKNEDGIDYPVGSMERALYLLSHAKCEEVTNLFQNYMKICQATKSSQGQQLLD